MGYGSFGSSFNYGGGSFIGGGSSKYGYDPNEGNSGSKGFIAILIMCAFILIMMFTCTVSSKKLINSNYTYMCQDTILLVRVNYINVSKHGSRSFSAYYDRAWIYCEDLGSGYYYKQYSIQTGDTLRLNVHLVKVYDSCEVHKTRFLTDTYAEYNFNRFHIN